MTYSRAFDLSEKKITPDKDYGQILIEADSEISAVDRVIQIIQDMGVHVMTREVHLPIRPS